MEGFQEKMMIQNLQQWLKDKNNTPSKEMDWEKDFWKQIMFVRDVIPEIFFGDNYEKYKDVMDNIQVKSTHESKSILLPVYHFRIQTDKIDIIFTMEYNFHNWVISVDSNKEIKGNFEKLFNRDSRKRGDFRDGVDGSFYCYGFPKDLIFESYKWNKKKFTVNISTDYRVYTFLWILKNENFD